MNAEAARYRIEGRVQGVGFRAWTVREARTLGVGGYVRNLPDGAVEVVAVAESSVLAEFEEVLRRGPPLARVAALRRWALGSDAADERVLERGAALEPPEFEVRY